MSRSKVKVILNHNTNEPWATQDSDYRHWLCLRMSSGRGHSFCKMLRHGPPLRWNETEAQRVRCKHWSFLNLLGDPNVQPRLRTTGLIESWFQGNIRRFQVDVIRIPRNTPILVPPRSTPGTGLKPDLTDIQPAWVHQVKTKASVKSDRLWIPTSIASFSVSCNENGPKITWTPLSSL